MEERKLSQKDKFDLIFEFKPKFNKKNLKKDVYYYENGSHSKIAKPMLTYDDIINEEYLNDIDYFDAIVEYLFALCENPNGAILGKVDHELFYSFIDRFRDSICIESLYCSRIPRFSRSLVKILSWNYVHNIRDLNHNVSNLLCLEYERFYF